MEESDNQEDTQPEGRPSSITAKPLVRKSGWALAVVLLASWLAASLVSVDWGAILSALAKARYGWIVAAIALHLPVYVFWALMWRHFTPPESRMPHLRMISVTTVFSLATNSIPYGGGHAAGTAYLARTAPMSWPLALAVLTQDQCARGLVKFGLLISALLAAVAPRWLDLHTQKSFLLGLAGLLVLLLAALIAGPRLARIGLPPRLANLVQAWRNGLAGFRSPAAVAHGFALCVLLKAFEFLPLFAVNRALGLDLSATETLIVFVSLNFATAYSLTPGNVGVYEAAATATLVFLGISKDLAVSCSLLYHVCWMIPMAGAGGIVLLWKGLANRRWKLRSDE